LIARLSRTYQAIELAWLPEITPKIRCGSVPDREREVCLRDQAVSCPKIPRRGVAEAWAVRAERKEQLDSTPGRRRAGTGARWNSLSCRRLLGSRPGSKSIRETLGFAKEPLDLAPLKQIQPAIGRRTELLDLRHPAKRHSHNQGRKRKGPANPHGVPRYPK